MKKVLRSLAKAGQIGKTGNTAVRANASHQPTMGEGENTLRGLASLSFHPHLHHLRQAAGQVGRLARVRTNGPAVIPVAAAAAALTDAVVAALNGCSARHWAALAEAAAAAGALTVWESAQWAPDLRVVRD